VAITAGRPGGNRVGLPAQRRTRHHRPRGRGGGLMLWVTWRHHRTQAAACLTLVVAASLLLYVLGTAMHTAWAGSPAGCLIPNAASDCDTVLTDFQTRFAGSTEQLLGWLNLLPPLVGAFIGAPLIAREFETGTWRLAFTQAVPRTRWLTTKVLLLGA